MQIPPISTAAQAAGGTVAQASKDHPTAVADAPTAAVSTVEQSGNSDPDRDAQGQGDGMQRHDAKRQAADDVLELGEVAETSHTAGHLPDEPPGELDLLA